MAAEILDENNEEVNIFTLTDEEGKESDYELIAECTLDGKEYYALVPADEESDEYIVLRLEEEDGETFLTTIDDDDEFERVADYFDNEVFAEIDYDEDGEN